MSLNLMAAIEQEDHHYEVRPMILARLGAGITSSARLSKGDTITFSGIDFDVLNIQHKHESHMTGRAPNSFVHARPHRPLDDTEIKMLRDHHGFEDMNA